MNEQTVSGQRPAIDFSELRKKSDAAVLQMQAARQLNPDSLNKPCDAAKRVAAEGMVVEKPSADSPASEAQEKLVRLWLSKTVLAQGCLEAMAREAWRVFSEAVPASEVAGLKAEVERLKLELEAWAKLTQTNGLTQKQIDSLRETQYDRGLSSVEAAQLFAEIKRLQAGSAMHLNWYLSMQTGSAKWEQRATTAEARVKELEAERAGKENT